MVPGVDSIVPTRKWWTSGHNCRYFVSAMTFEPFGPFALPRKNGAIDDSRKKEFWDQVNEECDSLPEAVGCYILGMRAGKGFKPWYVGKTEKQCFKDRTWNDKTFRRFESVLRERKGTPVVFLIAKKTPEGKFRKALGKNRRSGSIAALEEMLIGTCLQRNPKLLNQKLVKYQIGR